MFSCQQRVDMDEDYIPSREQMNFSEDWSFQKGETINNVNWKPINIPHTTNIEPLIVNDQWQGISWYKKNVTINVGDLGKKHFIYFEGVMQKAMVWCNGKLITEHKGGYLPFTADISDQLIKGENTIIVKVDNNDNTSIPPGKKLEDLDFNTYGGIYRNVFHIKTNSLFITNSVNANKSNGGGVLIHFDKIQNSLASGFVKVHIKNSSNQDRSCNLKVTIKKNDREVANFGSKEYLIKADSEEEVLQSIKVEEPELWSPEFPNLYEIEIQILEDGAITDFQKLKMGIRSITLNKEGFFLNGKKRFINGTNRHQEYPYIGYAISDEANYRDAFKIKKAGFDFVRLSHYPHSESFMNACDELGLMVMNCIPGWQYYEEEEFVKNSFQDIKDMVRRDRNHPSVIFWENSLNESAMTDAFMIEANNIVKEELPYDDTYTAGWIDHPSYNLYIPARQHGKFPDYWNTYNKRGRKVLIAEYGDWEYYAQNAGFNQKAFDDLKEDERSSRQLRGSGEKRLLQQALNFQEAFNSNKLGKNTIGHANWLMFDYNRGYAKDIESSGISDIFRLPKYSYYFYKSQSDPKDNGYTIFIANDWLESSNTTVKVFSNVEKVALYVNDKLIEKKKAQRIPGYSDALQFPPFIFEVDTYDSGKLVAIGYDKNDKEVIKDVIHTSEIPKKIILELDTSGKEISKNGEDILFVYAKIVDENNNVNTTANNPISFRIISGNAELIGENPLQSEAGIATILLKTNKPQDSIILEASSKRLKSDRINIK